jgi:O-succinylbenzoic acid--CoA ligase
VDLLPAAVAGHASAEPDACALIEGAGRWTWRDLDEMAEAVALGLTAAGLGPGDRVALLAAPTAAAIAFIHGAGRAGVVVAPISERLTAAEVSAFLGEIDATAIVADEGLMTRAGETGRTVLRLHDLTAGYRGPSRALPEIGPDWPALIVATSGTTGRPKGAVLTHGQMSASAASWNSFLPPATGWLASLSIAHVGGLGTLWRAALAGVPLVLPSDRGPGLDTVALLSSPVSHASMVAVQLARLLDGSVEPPPSLRALLVGGGPTPVALIERALEAGWPVIPTYGMTETASGVTALAVSEAASRPGSSGRALPGVRIRITNAGTDGVGDIEVNCPSVFEGYYARPAETAATMTADGWFRTGDMGALDEDGYLTVADRRLDLIVSGGENIYPAEIEAVLSGHPAVLGAGVVGSPDARWGAVPVAAVVLRLGTEVTDEELLRHCRAGLAGFKVPVRIVRVAELPRSGQGKLNRRALRATLAKVGAAGESAAGAVGRPAPHMLPACRYLVRPDGQRLAYRVVPRVGTGSGLNPTVLLLHSTLSSGWQLRQLAGLLAESAVVVLPDRRGSAGSRIAPPRPVLLADQVADAIALLDELDVAHVTVVGHSYGAVVALSLAATHPDRVDALVAYEPPMLGAVDMQDLGSGGGRLADVSALVLAAHAAGGAAAAAEAFLRAIGGSWVLDKAPAATRAAILAEGDGVLADVGAMDRATVELDRVVCRATLVTGDESEPFYAHIADAAARVMPAATRSRLVGLRHDAPITQPAAIAALVREIWNGPKGVSESPPPGSPLR